MERGTIRGRTIPGGTMRNLAILSILLEFGGCGTGVGEAGETGSTAFDPGLADAEVTSSTVTETAPEAEWVTLVERRMADRELRPIAFDAPSSRVRVITTMGPATSEFSPGYVVTNILDDLDSIPAASVRAQQFRRDVAVTDTTFVDVPAGRLYLFIAQQWGVPEWTVKVEGRVEPTPGSVQ